MLLEHLVINIVNLVMNLLILNGLKLMVMLMM